MIGSNFLSIPSLQFNILTFTPQDDVTLLRRATKREAICLQISLVLMLIFSSTDMQRRQTASFWTIISYNFVTQKRKGRRRFCIFVSILFPINLQQQNIYQRSKNKTSQTLDNIRRSKRRSKTRSKMRK